MNSCELVATISTLVSVIAKDKAADEISFLGAVFTQLGDTLATISTHIDLCEKKKDESDE